MRGKIFKQINSITEEEVCKGLEYIDITDFGDVFSYEEFTSMAEDYLITDYDGSGSIILDGKEVRNSELGVHIRGVYFDHCIVPWEVLYGIFGDRMKFIWFNK